MKLIEVNVWLDNRGWRASTNTLEVEEKPKTYAGKHRRIDKSDVMRVIGGHYDRNGDYSCSTWCLEGNEKAAIKLLANSIKPKFIELHKKINDQYELIKETLVNIEPPCKP